MSRKTNKSQPTQPMVGQKIPHDPNEMGVVVSDTNSYVSLKMPPLIWVEFVGVCNKLQMELKLAHNKNAQSPKIMEVFSVTELGVKVLSFLAIQQLQLLTLSSRHLLAYRPLTTKPFNKMAGRTLDMYRKNPLTPAMTDVPLSISDDIANFFGKKTAKEKEPFQKTLGGGHTVVCITPDGKTLVGVRHTDINYLNMATGNRLKQVRLDEREWKFDTCRDISILSCNNKGNRILVGAETERRNKKGFKTYITFIRDLNKPSQPDIVLPPQTGLHFIKSVFSPDGSRILIVVRSKDKISMDAFDAQTGKILDSLHPISVSTGDDPSTWQYSRYQDDSWAQIAYSPDNAFIVLTYESQCLVLQGNDLSQTICSATLLGKIKKVTFTPDNNLIIIYDDRSGAIFNIDAKNNVLSKELEWPALEVDSSTIKNVCVNLFASDNLLIECYTESFKDEKGAPWYQLRVVFRDWQDGNILSQEIILKKIGYCVRFLVAESHGQLIIVEDSGKWEPAIISKFLTPSAMLKEAKDETQHPGPQK